MATLHKPHRILEAELSEVRLLVTVEVPRAESFAVGDELQLQVNDLGGTLVEVVEAPAPNPWPGKMLQWTLTVRPALGRAPA